MRGFYRIGLLAGQTETLDAVKAAGTRTVQSTSPSDLVGPSALGFFKSLHFLDRFPGGALGVFELTLAAALLAEVASVE